MKKREKCKKGREKEENCMKNGVKCIKILFFGVINSFSIASLYVWGKKNLKGEGLIHNIYTGIW